MMKRKLLLATAGLFFLLFSGMAWFGVNSVARRLEMTRMDANFKGAEKAQRSGRNKIAMQNYRSAVVFYQRALSRGGYYLGQSDEYLIVGNCYWRLCQLRAALQCYEQGLRSDPWSITLLTTLGSCAFSLGETQKALAVLEKSQAIYPLKKSVRSILQELRAGNKREKR